MLRIRTRGGAPSGSRRRGRSVRSVAALVTTSLLAPAAVATVATTAVTTLQAAPAAARPRVYTVAGDATDRTGNGSGAWGFHGVDYSELRSLITNAANFGPSGTVTARFVIGDPIATISDETLAGVDVYFSGAVAGANGSGQSYNASERAALLRFVQRGGVLIINQNSMAWDTGQVLREAGSGNLQQQNPPAFFSPTDADDGGAPGLDGGYEAPYKPENDSTPAADAGRTVPGAPLVSGPFGTVSSYSMWHTVAGFSEIPSGGVINARVMSACNIANTDCAHPTTPPQSTTTMAPPTTTTTPDQAPREFNNNLNNLISLVTYAPGGAFTGLGGVVLTSDVDTYANHNEYNGGVMKPGNRTLALNTFAWAAGILDANNPQPVAPGYTSLASPERLLDTRNGVGVSAGTVSGGTTRTVQVAGAHGVPADATAVAVNVTVADASEPTFVTVYPDGPRPTTSNLNVQSSQPIANMAMVQLPANGRLTFYNNNGNAHIIADIVGYYAAGGELFNAVGSPDRVLDTRDTASPFGPGEARLVQVRGVGNNTVPANATAVVLNVTAATNTAPGYLTVYPGDATSVPGTSSLNFPSGQIVPNLVVAKLSPGGAINIFNFAGSTHVLVDVFGYFVPATDTGSSFTALSPDRMVDTRGEGGLPNLGRVPAGGVLEMTAINRSGVPATGVTSVLVNVTAIAPTEDSFVTVYPQDPRPGTSNLNTRVGVVAVPNLVVARVGGDGRIRLYNNSGSVDLAVDVMGYFAS